MIPQRVKLSGFLSYKDEQEVRFDGAPLWMLSGTNGSGKSSIFDAVTFALFGHHRGGSQSASELINKESNALAVEFDFSLDQQQYRIKRTVRRRTSSVASTQQIFQRARDASEGNADDAWDPIPDTQLRVRFDAWIKEKIGLDYESFTSSVLLLQGKSEKLLDSTPAGRASVLARIVDLERYQKLHAKADDRRRALKATVEGIGNQLSALRDVSDEELAAAIERIENAQDLQAKSQDSLDRLDALAIQARNWADHQKKLGAIRDKLTHAEALLSHAVAIEKDFTRLKELRDVLPAVSTIVTERGRISESERKTERFTAERETSTESRRITEHALSQARKKLVALRKTQSEDEVRQASLNARLRELAAVLEQVKQVEDAEAEVKRLEREFQALPSDPEGALQRLQAEQERLALLAQHYALLERLHQDRSELTKASAAAAQARLDEAKLREAGVQAKEAFTALEAKAKAAREERAAKDQAAAEARALAQLARQLANEFQELTGARTCRACGQELTAQHFEEEKARREHEATEAERKLKALTTDATAARKREAELDAKEAAEREHLHALREQFKDAAASVKQAALDSKRLTDSCRQSYFALPQEFKEKIGPREPADWSTVAYPDRNDLSGIAAETKRLDGVKRQVRTAQDEVANAQTVRAKLDSGRDRLAKAKLALPTAEAGTLRQEYAAKQAEDTSVANALKAGKTELGRTETEIERQQRSLADLDRELTELAGKLNLEEASRKQSSETIERMKKTLPAAWQKPLELAGMGERAKWQSELDVLVNKGTEAKYTNLQAARGGLDSLRAEIAQIEQEANAFPVEARRAPEEVQSLIAAAREEIKQRNAELLAAQREKSILDNYHNQRAELNTRYMEADAELTRYKMLAELLGRDRLQRWLVEKAEGQIVDYANGVLDRLSGGQMFLRQVKAESGNDKAFDLECANRAAGGSPINVAFLSGSQRFRVAVALALGIGQYASKQHRAIESVIIDEGFGCLDRAGRQVMIQELQNLRGHLHCILLVSHQEEFADAFPDGYRFELQDGATRINRFVR